ncbi:MAG: PEGA domain-containing protein [Lentisphaerae bacterium]|nr:PEGA domain-containing protein [Lentisphaerota bacterium]MCP4099935.1 PEGA domain-containing protein [Lentisphaerota bacterium]
MNKIIYIICFSFCLLLLPGCGKKAPKDKRGELQINTDPSGAEIFSLKNKSYGVTPRKLKPLPSTYLLKIVKDKYRPVWKSITMKPREKKTVNIKLEPITGSLLIKSRPSGAKVTINKRALGLTPLIIPRLPLGPYTATIDKTGYAVRESKFEIKDSRPKEILISLDSNIGQLVLKSTPSHARVFINGTPRGYTPYKTELESGKYKLILNKNGFGKVEETVLVKRDNVTSKSYFLRQLPCNVNVSSTPSGAKIYINNKPYGTAPLKNIKLNVGKYSIRAEQKGFDPFSKEFYATAGKNIQVSMPLIGNTGGADVVINPPGSTVYFNGKRYCVSQPSETDGVSKVIKIRNITAGRYRITAAHKLGKPDKKSVYVTIQKGKIVRTTPITLWVPNAEMKLIKHPKILGILYKESKYKVLFSPQPGIKMEYKRSEIQYLNRLKKDENGNIIYKK